MAALSRARRGAVGRLAPGGCAPDPRGRHARPDDAGEAGDDIGDLLARDIDLLARDLGGMLRLLELGLRGHAGRGQAARDCPVVAADVVKAVARGEQVVYVRSETDDLRVGFGA